MDDISYEIRILDPEKFEGSEIVTNHKGYVSIFGVTWKDYDEHDRYPLLKEIIDNNDKAKALLNMNNQNSRLIRCICRNIVMNNCRFKIRKV